MLFLCSKEFNIVQEDLVYECGLHEGHMPIVLHTLGLETHVTQITYIYPLLITAQEINKSET